MLKVSSIKAIVLALVAIMVSIPSSAAANSSTIEDIIVNEKRYVLYNSRRLSGECLDICVTKNPTASPVIETGGSTPDPTLSPTVHVCEEKKVIDVCVAIDNSGSICTEGNNPKLCSDCDSNQPCESGGVATNVDLCCGNYEGVTTFAKNYVSSLNGLGTVSVVKYGSTASVISPQGSADDAETAIETSAYTGGYTNTEDAIKKCKKELKGTANPVIVLITDGTPTACNGDNRFRTQWNHGGECDNGPPADAAIALANKASRAGMSLVPVVINSVSKNVAQLSDLARCPVNDSNCDVESYKNLHVDNIENLGDVLDSLILSTGCE